jgi:DNA mismatch endonuclease, patch repair protein
MILPPAAFHALDEAPPSAERSAVMSKVRSSNTRPEMIVRSELHQLGYRYKLHDARLPGKPDLAFPSRTTAIFVHGCFWHRHQGCRRASTPKTRRQYWEAKFRRNVDRDVANVDALERLGWTVLILWECEISGRDWIVRVRQVLDRVSTVVRPSHQYEDGTRGLLLRTQK